MNDYHLGQIVGTGRSQDYNAHVGRLLAQTGIEYRFVTNILDSRYVVAPQACVHIPNLDRPLSEIEYAACLHELGHAHDHIRPTLNDDFDAVFDSEVRAWGWAAKHAIRWTPVMVKFQWLALQSYVNQMLIKNQMTDYIADLGR